MNEVNKKRRNASRVISLIVAVALMFIVSACNGEEAAVGSTSEETQTVETTEQETSTDAAVEPEAGPFDEFMEIEWLGFNMRAGLEEGTEIELFFEEKYNVDFVWPDLVDWSSSEKISVSIAAGELPEFCAVLRSDEFDLYDQGLTRSIPNKMIREFAPNYAAILEDEGGWLLQKVADADESICMYEYYKRECNNVASYYRYDWMKDLGIEANGEVVESLVDGVYSLCRTLLHLIKWLIYCNNLLKVILMALKVRRQLVWPMCIPPYSHVLEYLHLVQLLPILKKTDRLFHGGLLKD